MSKSLFLTVIAVAAALAAGLGAGYVLWGGDDSAADGPGDRGATTSSAPQAPPSLENCNHETTEGCEPGAEIVITDGQWRCRGPLAEYAEQEGGTLPLKVTAAFTTYVNTSGPVIDLREGCTGDGTEAIDLILDIQGDGRTVGGTNDALSVKLDAHDLDITGTINCGPRGPEAHPDGIQAMGGSNIAFVDIEIGDWDEERATCTGASGGIDISRGGQAQIQPTDYLCLRCRVIACRRAISIEDSLRVTITDGAFRSGNPAEREEQLATGLTGVCNFGLSACEIFPLAQEVVFEGNVCEKWPWAGSRRR